MNKFICIMFALLMGVGTVFAEGGKNQGDTGTGDPSTGEDAQGKADQGQTGRGDADVYLIINEYKVSEGEWK